MEYTKWKLHELGHGIIVDEQDFQVAGTSVRYIGAINQQEANAHLVVAAVNGCTLVNPDNPQAVAEGIKHMYEALKFAVRQIEELHRLKGDFGLTNAILGLAKQVLAEVEGK